MAVSFRKLYIPIFLRFNFVNAFIAEKSHRNIWFYRAYLVTQRVIGTSCYFTDNNGERSTTFFRYRYSRSISRISMKFANAEESAKITNVPFQLQIGKKSIQALAKRYGTKYTTGNIAETICKYTFCSFKYNRRNYDR